MRQPMSSPVARKHQMRGGFKLMEVRMNSSPNLEHDIFVAQIENIESFAELMHAHINSWLAQGESLMSSSTIQDIFACIKQLFNMMGFRWGKHLIVPTVIYVDRFIGLTGKTDYPHIFNWLLISSLVTIKFWGEDEFDVDYNLTSFVSGISLRDIVKLEREFLGGLQYTLYLRHTDIEEWVVKNIHYFLLPPQSDNMVISTPFSSSSSPFGYNPNSTPLPEPSPSSSVFSPFGYDGMGQAISQITLACE